MIKEQLNSAIQQFDNFITSIVVDIAKLRFGFTLRSNFSIRTSYHQEKNLTYLLLKYNNSAALR